MEPHPWNQDLQDRKWRVQLRFPGAVSLNLLGDEFMDKGGLTDGSDRAYYPTRIGFMENARSGCKITPFGFQSGLSPLCAHSQHVDGPLRSHPANSSFRSLVLISQPRSVPA